MSSSSHGCSLAADDQRRLVEIARRSIHSGLRTGAPASVELSGLSPALAGKRASFVTLHLDGALRGCIGALEAFRPLAQDVAHNAFAAAFRDPRFAPVSEAEAPRLAIHLSLLTAPEPMAVTDEADLLARIRPGVDGLILSDGTRRGTFLPSVWEQLPDPAEFLLHLKHKAGLPGDYWSPTLNVARYQAESIDAADFPDVAA